MAKLNNLQIVKSLLDGTSKYHGSKSVGYEDLEKKAEMRKSREVGEIWEEKNADGTTHCWWEQRESYRVRYNVHPDIAKELHSLKNQDNLYPNCKYTCRSKKKSKLDEKMQKIHGMCFDCVIEMETKLKMEGKFNDYARNKMRNNAQAFFVDADREVEVLKESLKKIEYVNQDGREEKWEMTNKDAFIEKVDEDYKNFKETVLNSFNPGE